MDERLTKSLEASKEELAIQRDGLSLIGMEEVQRKKIVAQRKIALELAKETAAIDRMKFDDEPDDLTAFIRKQELKAKAREKAETDTQTALLKIQEEYVNQQVQQYDEIFRKGFADMLNGGEDAWKSFSKSLVTTFKTTVADQIYKMFLRPIVVNIVGSFAGILGLGGADRKGGSAGTLLSLASNANTALSLFNGSWGSTLLGNSYAYGMLTPGLTAGSQQAAMLAAQTGDFGFAGLQATQSAAAYAPGAAVNSMWSQGGMGWAGVAVAIPMIAAYLGGMFKDEVQVGQGLTGTLGGDLYGYQLLRESGGLFDGPDYRYIIAEKEIKKTKAEIEALKNDPSLTGEKGEGERAYRLQRLYTRLDRLEREYGTQIEGTKGPIKILQDAFTNMRENTASQADILHLDGDSIRKMTVELGLDTIHPDTGGKGLELTGLTQEEAQKKIQDALNQANEELARSVLGSWQQQTKEVTKLVWEQVWVPDDSDAGGSYQRVGKEVTETLTEQVWVMSEYVREGETAVQALGRLSGSLSAANTVMDLLGDTLFDTSLAGGDLASDLMDAFGGADKFTAATGNFYDKFYTDQEKVQNQTRLLNAELKKLGIETMPTSREALRDYINSLDLTTEEGQKLYASLLGLVGQPELVHAAGLRTGWRHARRGRSAAALGQVQRQAHAGPVPPPCQRAGTVAGRLGCGRHCRRPGGEEPAMITIAMLWYWWRAWE
ncbi:hypothetical protein GCM10027082_14070 [Comamonas humi]